MIDKHLLPGERIVFDTKLNWTAYLSGMTVILVGFLFVSYEGYGGELVVFLGALMLGYDGRFIHNSKDKAATAFTICISEVLTS